MIPSGAALALLLDACGFSLAAYRATSPDLSAMSDAAAAEHLVRHGAREGRRIPVALRLDKVRRLHQALSGEPEMAAHVLDALFTMHIRGWRNPLDRWGAQQGAALAMAHGCGGRPVLVFGDSHAIIYAAQKATRGGSWLLPVDLRCIGASARGLGRDKSSSGNGSRIVKLLAHGLDGVPSSTPLLFAFGQVDLEFVLPYTAITKRGRDNLTNGDVADFIGETVDRYVCFLTSAVPASRRAATTVASVLPPTLSDAHWAEGYISALVGVADDLGLSASLRAFRIPPIAARATMHRSFNAELEEAARRAGFRFLDAFSAFAGPDGCVSPRYAMEAGGRNHHLDQSPATFYRADDLLWGVLGR